VDKSCHAADELELSRRSDVATIACIAASHTGAYLIIIIIIILSFI